jgi:alpha-L-fucosidase
MRSLQNGDANGTVWRPGETDVSIRPGWFYHPAEDDRVKSVDELVDLYFTSVGRNSKLLLNVPPTPDGLLHQTDVSRLAAMRARLDTLFAVNIADTHQSWRASGDRRAVAEIDVIPSPPVAMARLSEDITRGQAVASYTLDGLSDAGWSVLARGTTIGYCKLEKFAASDISRVRLTINDAVARPSPVRVALYTG